MRVLLVEDEESVAEPLAAGLRREGFDVTWVANAADAVAASEHDLVLLDLRLPDRDGYEVCRELRGRSSVPIIVISARGEEVDRIVGLELGADDYLVKPFGFRELLARINAVTRRVGERPPDAAIYRLGALTLDSEGRRVLLGGDELELTAKEFDLLMALAVRPGAVVSRQRLLDEVWDGRHHLATKTIDVHVASLRRKLGDPGWIQTVRGIGFRLRAP
jgi:two-component system, OmpR family, response regulator RegX3